MTYAVLEFLFRLHALAAVSALADASLPCSRADRCTSANAGRGPVTSAPALPHHLPPRQLRGRARLHRRHHRQRLVVSPAPPRPALPARSGVAAAPPAAAPPSAPAWLRPAQLRCVPRKPSRHCRRLLTHPAEQVGQAHTLALRRTQAPCLRLRLEAGSSTRQGGLQPRRCFIWPWVQGRRGPHRPLAASHRLSLELHQLPPPSRRLPLGPRRPLAPMLYLPLVLC